MFDGDNPGARDFVPACMLRPMTDYESWVTVPSTKHVTEVVVASDEQIAWAANALKAAPEAYNLSALQGSMPAWTKRRPKLNARLFLARQPAYRLIFPNIRTRTEQVKIAVNSIANGLDFLPDPDPEPKPDLNARPENLHPDRGALWDEICRMHGDAATDHAELLYGDPSTEGASAYHIRQAYLLVVLRHVCQYHGVPAFKPEQPTA